MGFRLLCESTPIAEILWVLLVPTYGDAVQFRGPWNAQFFADVAAMDLNGLMMM
jgi:hypothetical protein